MQIKNMFEKQIDRDIKGVIKVGQSDEENVYLSDPALEPSVTLKVSHKEFLEYMSFITKAVI